MAIDTTINFDYCKNFTEMPCHTQFSYKLEVLTFSEPNFYTRISDKRTFKKPVLLTKLLITCLLKNIELLIKDKTCLTQIKTFLVHFDKFNPIVKDREILIFLSLILNTQNIKDAVFDYFQIVKRCAIRDYWQWVVFEDYDHNLEKKDYNFDPIAVFSILMPGPGLLVPFFNRNTRYHPLQDYGYDPKDGVWKRLDYQQILCQKGNLIVNYNIRTCNIIKVNPTQCVYKYLNKDFQLIERFRNGSLFTDTSQSLFLAAMPPVISTIIINSYKYIYEFIIGPKHFTSKNFIVGLSPEAQDLIIRLLDHEDKDQKDSFLMFLKSYNPSKTDFERIDTSHIYN
jgi:hypothetical protein